MATGRQLRHGVPTAHSKLLVDRQWGGDVRSLRTGERVTVQDQQSRHWNRTGTVIESRGNRQYTVRLYGSGQIILRTRRHLRPVTAEAVTSEESSEQLPDTPADEPSAAPSLRPLPILHLGHPRVGEDGNHPVGCLITRYNP